MILALCLNDRSIHQGSVSYQKNGHFVKIQRINVHSTRVGTNSTRVHEANRHGLIRNRI